MKRHQKRKRRLPPKRDAIGLLDSVLGQVSGQSSNASDVGGGVAALLPALMAVMAANAGGGTGDLGSQDSVLRSGGGSASAGGGISGMVGDRTGGGGAQGSQAVGLGSMLGGAGIAVGLGQLLRSFEQNGHGAAAQSWVGDGASASVSPNQVGQALGPDTIAQLASHTGLSQDDVTRHLSRVLPEAVHQLTPNGRLPTLDEASQWV